MSRRPASSTLATVALVVVLAVAIAAMVLFDRGAEDDAASAEPSQTPSATVEQTVTESPVPAELPVPDGVVVTEPGTELALGASATLAWQPRQEQVGVVEAEVRDVERTTFERSFSGWQLDDATRATTPWFVRVALRNVGEEDLGGRAVPLYGLGSSGRLIQASGFATRFDPCPGNGAFPASFAPGQQGERCLVLLVPEGEELEGVAFRPADAVEAIVWEVPAQASADPSRQPRERDRDRDRDRGDG